MKAMFLKDVMLANVKTSTGHLTACITNVKKGDVLNVYSANIVHDKRQHVIGYADISWERDGWKHSATLGTSHYPHDCFELIPETPFEESLIRSSMKKRLSVSKKQQEQADYLAWLEKHRLESERNLARLKKTAKVAEVKFWQETARKNAVLPPRLEQKYTPGVGAKKDTLKYTGDKMLGIATMHKSSMVPVFSGEEAVDISKMRRG